MKKLLVFIALVVGLGALVKRFGPKMQNVDWERQFDRLPDNAPPKWMFRNISAIRENTERILELVDEDHRAVAASHTDPATATA